MPETTITIHLTEETGQMAYVGLATIAQGSTAHLTRFEYFGEDDILSAIGQALEKLRHLQQHPPQLKPVETEPETPVNLDDEPDEEPDDLDEDEPDADFVSTPAAPAAVPAISDTQLSLF